MQSFYSGPSWAVGLAAIDVVGCEVGGTDVSSVVVGSFARSISCSAVVGGRESPAPLVSPTAPFSRSESSCVDDVARSQDNVSGADVAAGVQLAHPPRVVSPQRTPPVSSSGKVVCDAGLASAGNGDEKMCKAAVDTAWATYVHRSEARAAGHSLADADARPSYFGSLFPSMLHSPKDMPPSMVHEAVDAVLEPGVRGTYVDAAFGRGAYSSELLRNLPQESSLVICVDAVADPLAAVSARELMRTDSRVTAVLSCSLGEVGCALAGQEIVGVIADLSCAWLQDDPLKGSSCLNPSAFDLRANTTRGCAASDWLKTATVEEVAWVLHAYGEDDDPILALRLAEAIMERQRRNGPYQSVHQFADVARRLKGHNDERGLHPAKLAINALRVFVNGELEQLQDFMEDVMPLLSPRSRLAVVTTRRVEAAVVKSFIRRHEECHPSFVACASPRRLSELYPLLQTTANFAVVQACEPLWPSAIADARGRRPPRSWATHVLERAPRQIRANVSDSCGESAGGPIVRQDHELFVQPCALPFGGGC
eukprot:TRINITY_DN49935_c0_g1_i1.p1 TRINITY_DN49935_c0_g1~~TRINITY_DN49935_c0_g1_i1.p1  ORF type:complete len:538 (+),score=68.73 TRINITY_DN49935_c0_g1_i1:18-1631(+)